MNKQHNNVSDHFAYMNLPHSAMDKQLHDVFDT